MNKTLLFLDPDSPMPYTYEALGRKPLSGVAATVLRITEGLAERSYRIVLAQAKRSNMERSQAGVLYVPFRRESLAVLPQKPDVVVLLNTTRLLGWAGRTFQKASLFVWLHNYPGKHKRKFLCRDALLTDAVFLSVSQTLTRELGTYLDQYPLRNESGQAVRERPSIYTLYNPISDTLLPDSRAYNRWKLLFYSPPHKGLCQVLETFRALRQYEARYHLYIANPGRWQLPEDLESQQVHVLGPLAQQEIIRHVRDSFCVFYTQNTFRETFGLVFTEANAVGTPVLAHPFGSAEEILENKQQLVDITDIKGVAERLENWQNKGRPGVRLPKHFRLQQVIDRWEQALRMELAERSSPAIKRKSLTFLEEKSETD